VWCLLVRVATNRKPRLFVVNNNRFDIDTISDDPDACFYFDAISDTSSDYISADNNNNNSNHNDDDDDDDGILVYLILVHNFFKKKDYCAAYNDNLCCH
jgi:hypothetical protein